MAIESADDDPERSYSQSEKDQLTSNLYVLAEHIRQSGNHSQPYSSELICRWHRALFSGVRDHAGRMRAADFGTDVLSFGPHYSCRREEVAELIERHTANVNVLNRQITSQTKPIELVRAALYLHAEFIFIHPFEDGNGRIGRLIANFWLRRWGLPGLVIEATKREYVARLNHYYMKNDLQPLLDWAMRLYAQMFKI